jgi:hypothetical protein
MEFRRRQLLFNFRYPGVGSVIPPGNLAEREAVPASAQRLVVAPSQVVLSPVAVLLAASGSFSSAIPGGGGGLDRFFHILSRVLSVRCKEMIVFLLF